MIEKNKNNIAYIFTWDLDISYKLVCSTNIMWLKQGHLILTHSHVLLRLNVKFTQGLKHFWKCYVLKLVVGH
jgi:hypothetical protein